MEVYIGLIVDRFNQSQTAAIILLMALILFSGFLVARITKRLHLPNVTGYLLAGILIGPHVFGLVRAETVTQLDFVTDVSLALISFGVGKYFKAEELKQSGLKIIVITLCESLTAGALVTLAMIFIFKLSVPFSFLVGSIACATAPASTIMTIRQYNAKGPFVRMLLQIIALGNVIALVAFSICTTMTAGIEGSDLVSATQLWLPVIFLALSVVGGIISGFVLCKVLNEKRSREHRLILTVGAVLLLTGLCSLVNISPMLGCMALGTAYINFHGNQKVFEQVDNFVPPILMFFFVLSGMRLNLSTLASAGMIGVTYFFVRILGKFLGAAVGTSVCKEPKETVKYLGMALIPQAGVSIGLAILGQRLLPQHLGTLLNTIILSSAVLYEIVGPALAKASLVLTGSIERPAKEPSKEPKA